MPSLTRRFIRNFGLVALFVAAALFGIASGVMFAFLGDLPQISALDDYAPATTTRVLGRDGSVVGEFASERRQLVTYEQIPAVLRNAIVSSEDGDFFHHSGVNLSRIAVTAIRRYVLRVQRRGGASTITQQLARKLFLTDEETPERKIKEILLSIQIEKRYTKQEIFTMYCNKMFFGHLTYGVEAASQLYFAKHVSDLTLDEAALIAGILQRNDAQSPYRNMPAAVARRNSVLTRMAEEGYITAADADAAKKRPIVTRGEPARPRSIAPYFSENIRIQLEARYGAKALYEGGLTIRTGLDVSLQQAANRAIDTQLRRLDKTRGFRKPAHNLVAEGKTFETYKNARWTRDPADGEIVPAVVLNVDATLIHVWSGRWQGVIDKAGYDWTNRKPESLVRRGDVIDIRVRKLDPKTTTLTADLEQTPLLEGAALAIDNHTGEVLMMVGGQSFERSQFNRATQALRQVGSLFKPFVFTAAIDAGYTASSRLDDSPASFVVGPGQPLYEPKNFDRKFEGDISLRRALEDSRNVPTIRLMDALTPPRVIQVARNLGITSPLPPFLSVAIGSAEATLWDMTSAYTAFPNQGVRMTPTVVLGVTDREGNVLEETRPQAHEAIRADTAFIITNLLQGVIQHGTGQGAQDLNWTLAGKTGTTDEYTDAWFIGFDPDITIGVWVGFDQKKTIGADMEGARAALPMWKDIMKNWVDRRRVALPDGPVFERPGNIVVVMTDSGPEAYIAGTQPGIR